MVGRDKGFGLFDMQEMADRDQDAVLNDWVDRVYSKGQRKEEVTKLYEQWTQEGSYDQLLDREIYRGNKVLSSAMAELFPPDARANIRVLDVAAGTGLTGIALHEKGFKQIDAFDPSEGMLQQARQKGIYTNFIRDYMSDKETQIIADTYDAVTVCGAFGEGHLPCSALHEMIRVTKPGGHVAFVICEHHLIDVEEYKDRLEPLMDRLVTQGKWVRIRRQVYPNHVWDENGVLYIFKVK